MAHWFARRGWFKRWLVKQFSRRKSGLLDRPLYRQPSRSVAGAQEKIMQLTIEEQKELLDKYHVYMEKIIQRLGIKDRDSSVPQKVLWRDVVEAFEQASFERAHDETTLMRTSQVDEKTKLLKHDAFVTKYEKMRQELLIKGQPDRYVVFVFFDIDFFKKINAIIGHDLADEVLRQIGEKMRQLRTGDYASRFGGDEFTFFMRGVRRDDIAKAVRRIHRAVSMTKIPELVRAAAAIKGLTEVTVSFGAVAFPETEAWSCEKAKEVSDAIGYTMKNSGRNGYAVALYENDSRKILIHQRKKNGDYCQKYKGSEEPQRKESDYRQDVRNALQRILEEISVRDKDLGEEAATKAEQIGGLYFRALNGSGKT